MRLRHGIVRGVPARVGVTDDVEPVPAPPFAIPRRFQQSINDLLERVWRVVREKSVQFRRRRRQTGQIKGNAPQQGPWIGRRRRTGARRLEPGEDEVIHGGLRPGCILHLRQRRGLHWPKRPERPSFFQAHANLCDRRRGTRIRSPHLDPCNQVGDLHLRQLPLRRHLQVFVHVTHRPNQQALLRVTRHERRPRVAPLP